MEEGGRRRKRFSFITMCTLRCELQMVPPVIMFSCKHNSYRRVDLSTLRAVHDWFMMLYISNIAVLHSWIKNLNISGMIPKNKRYCSKTRKAQVTSILNRLFSCLSHFFFIPYKWNPLLTVVRLKQNRFHFLSGGT